MPDGVGTDIVAIARIAALMHDAEAGTAVFTGPPAVAALAGLLGAS
jgi:phosphopantetheinyl transferase (holo-ACP synthase)